MVRWAGRWDFASCLAEQLRLRQEIIAGTGSETLILVEHPPTITFGRRGLREHVLWTDEQLAAAQVELCDTPRGGELTLHAPGQLVAYPVVHVGMQIREHVMRMASVTMALLAELGVDGTHYDEELPGVWRGALKLASVGIHVSRGVAIQGMSINLDVEPHLFGALVSCGEPDLTITSVARVRGGPLPPMEQLARRWAEAFAADGGWELADSSGVL